jgi:hypothetical protein
MQTAYLIYIERRRRLAQERRETTPDAPPSDGSAPAFTISVLQEDKPATPVAPLAPAPVLETSSSPAEPAPAVTPSPAEIAPAGRDTAAEKGSTSAEKSPAARQHGPRLARVPGRQRRRHTDVCVRHPGEAKRNAGARAWLTPEESEKLELLATAYQVSTSTLTREIIVEGLAAHADLIEKTRRFLDSLGKGRVGA